MARRRFIPTSDYALSTTKGHSVLRQRPYSPGFHRRPVDDLYDYSYARRHLPYDTTGNENYTRSEVNRELMLSSAALDDGFDIASKSRNRDRDVMSAANRAIVATETYQSPRSSVIARRALRGNAQPVVFSSSKNVQKKEAALVGRKVDIVRPENRRARSKYAQDRMRKIHLEHREEISPAVTASSSLRASKPFRAPQLIKAIRDVDGFKKPNNVLSWKYKLESLASPDDLIYCPRSMSAIRSRLSDAKEKLDRHRQLMDRYLPSDDGLSAEDRRVLEQVKASRGPRE